MISPGLRMEASITNRRRQLGLGRWNAWPWRAARPVGPNRKPDMLEVPVGLQNRADGHQRGRAGPGYCPGHVPRSQHHLHREERVRAVQQPVRGHVPASGRAGHRHVAARREAWPPDLHQARVPSWPDLQHRVDGAAARQHAGQEQPVGRLSGAPCGDRVSRGWVRSDRPGAEHLHVGLQPGQRRPRCTDAERLARARHGVGAGAGGRVRGRDSGGAFRSPRPYC